MSTPRDIDVETATKLPRVSRAASQRRAMQAAMAAAVRAMRTSGVRTPAERTSRSAGRPPTEA